MPRRETASPTRSRSRVRPLSSSPPRLLIAVDAFGDDHIRALSDAAGGGATCHRLGQDASADTYARAMAGAEVMIGWPEPEWLADSGLRLLLLLPSAGYEEYLTPELAAKEGLVVCNAGGAYSEGVAEHCVAMMMALVRRLPSTSRPCPGTAGSISTGTAGCRARRCASSGWGPWDRPSPGGARLWE